MSTPCEKIEHQPPMALAMVISDAIWIDPSTGKRTILGTFTIIGARSFPAVHPTLSVYICVTDGRGKTPLKLRIIDVDEENDPLFNSEIDLEFDDPRAIIEINFQINGITFPEPGEYRVQLFCVNEPIIERRLVVIDASEKPQ